MHTQNRRPLRCDKARPPRSPPAPHDAPPRESSGSAGDRHGTGFLSDFRRCGRSRPSFSVLETGRLCLLPPSAWKGALRPNGRPRAALPADRKPCGTGRVVGSPEAGAQGFAAAGSGPRPPGRTQHAAPRWPASGPGCPDASGGFSQSGSVPVFGGPVDFSSPVLQRRNKRVASEGVSGSLQISVAKALHCFRATRQGISVALSFCGWRSCRTEMGRPTHVRLRE